VAEVKRYWRFLVPAALLVVVLGVLLVNLSSSLVYFITPTELIAANDDTTERRRLGGQVVTGTVVEEPEGIRFDVTDGRETVAVYHSGAPQQLFQEGIGVVVEGTWNGSEFHSDVMLVKHDEQYRTEDGTEYDHENQDEDSAAP
jgi:cytochrome c-type biogenesis protein CcmE